MSAQARLSALRPDARILVLDDAPVNVRLLEEILRRGGYTDVRGLTDSSIFEAELASFGPDIILLDLHMPDPNGLAILARLAEIAGDAFLPVLVLTGDATSDARDRALGAGAHDFLTKPFDATEVLLRVRNLLETRFLYLRLEERAVRLVGDKERSEAARAGIVGALNRVASNQELDQLATSVCRELLARTPFTAAGVLSLPGAGLATMLAAEGNLVGDDLRTGPVPAKLARHLAARAAAGPWFEAMADGAADEEYAARVARTGVRTILYVPLVDDDRPVGILAAGIDREPAELAGSADGGIADLFTILGEHGAIARALLVPELVARHREAALRAELDAVIRDRSFSPVFQPVLDLDTGEILGAEALTRFTDRTRPDVRFEGAAEVGVGLRLETVTLEAAVAASALLPAGIWLSVNVSPALVLSGDTLGKILAGVGRSVVLEITEHVPVADYPLLRGAIDRLGPQVRLAIDDAGAGFASFRHILELRPDFVKLDMGLVRGIDADPARQALVAGMRFFATKTRCTLVAEGIETLAESAMLRSLAVRIGQGYLLGRPVALPWEPSGGASSGEAADGPRRTTRSRGEVPLEASS
jgi:EAL domain-containing protein (putative c-di-GMP-specific phosphodiesterase class I)/DNA-binding response OmpR family regulator